MHFCTKKIIKMINFCCLVIFLASLPGTSTAHQLVQAIRLKCTTEEVLNILNELPVSENNNDMVEATFNPLKIDVFVQTLLNLGSKSFSHSFAAIAKFHLVFKVSPLRNLKCSWMSFMSLYWFRTDDRRFGRGSGLLVAQFVRAMEQSSANDVRFDWQIVKDTDCWMFGCSHLDILQRDEQWFHQNVLVGNSSFDYQENEQTCHEIE